MGRRSRELDEARDNMRNIIRDLRILANEIEQDYQGIGQDLCARSLRRIASFYENTVLRNLENMQLSWGARLADGIERGLEWATGWF